MIQSLRSLVPLVATAVCLAAMPASAALLSFVEVTKDGVGSVDGLDDTRTVAVSPDGAHVYTASEVDDAVAVFSRNPGTGALTFVEMHQDGVAGVDGLDGATFVTVSPDGAHLYVAGIADNTVVVFARNGATGALTFVEQHKDGVGGVDGLFAATAVTLSPDGAHVYASSYYDKAVAVFSRNAGTGALTFVEAKKNGVGGVLGLDGANSVVVSPDGAHVYVASLADSAVAVFSRSATTGALTFVQRRTTTGIDPVASLASADAVTISPDGAHVYVGSFVPGNAVSVFSRNVATGTLTFVEAEVDGAGGVDGLRGIGAVAVSPDGTYVLAASIVDDAVAVFSRAPATGALTFIDVERDGRGGTDGLDGAASVTVSPDGVHVYASSVGDDAVAVFRHICAGIAPGDPCDDGDPCTTDDRCLLGQCVDAAAPPLGCRLPTTSGKALVKLRDRSDDDKDGLMWKWTKGAATAKGDFGAPLATDDYAFCVYDGATLALGATAPAGGMCAGHFCWAEKPRSFLYKDKDRTPGGLAKIVLKEGLEDGKASIQVTGSGSLLGLPDLSTLASPLRVRLTNRATAGCWEAVYSFSPEDGNDAMQFKDKAD